MKKGLFKKVMGAVLASTFLFTLVSCGGGANKGTSAAGDKAKSKVQEIKDKGVLTLGTSANYPPYEFHKNIDGKDTIIGFDIEIAKEIAKELGVKLEITDMKFESLVASLQTGTVDMVIAGMNPTEERQKSVDFSNIYYTAEHGIIILNKDKDKYTNKDSLKGKTVGAQKGTIQEGLAKEQISDVKFKGLNTVSDLIMDMRVGNIDAVVCELPVAEYNLKKSDDLHVITDTGFKVDETEKGSAIAMPKGSGDLVELVNKVIKKLADEGKIDKFIVEANELIN